MNQLPIMTRKQNSPDLSGNILAPKIRRQESSSHRQESAAGKRDLMTIPAIAKRKNRKPTTDYRLLAETLKKECMEKDARIKVLEHRNQLLCSSLERIKEIVSHIPEA